MDCKVTTILIADDHPLLLEGLVKQIETCYSFKVIGKASNGIQAWEQFINLKPDITILDIDMDGIDGIQLTEKIKSYDGKAKVILLTMHTEPWTLIKAKNVKPNGILLKNISPNEIVNSIKKVLKGEKIFSPEIYQIVNDCTIDYDSILSLTTREIEVLKLITHGNTTIQIAEKLFLSVNTIETYRKNLLLKFDTPNVAALVKRATEMGML